MFRGPTDLWGFLFDQPVLLAISIDWLKLGEYLILFLLGTIKFWVSVIIALGRNYNLIEIFLCCTLAAVIGVYFMAYFGKEIRKWWDKKFVKRKQRSFASRRRIVRFWKKYGLWGAAFLGPFISPPASVLIAVSFREKPERITRAMTISLVFWTLIFNFFGSAIENLIG